MTAAQIRDAARLAGADATAENCLSRTGEVAEIWMAGFIAALEAVKLRTTPTEYCWHSRVVDEELAVAREVAETVGRP